MNRMTALTLLALLGLSAPCRAAVVLAPALPAVAALRAAPVAAPAALALPAAALPAAAPAAPLLPAAAADPGMSLENARLDWSFLGNGDETSSSARAELGFARKTAQKLLSKVYIGADPVFDRAPLRIETSILK